MPQQQQAAPEIEELKWELKDEKKQIELDRFISDITYESATARAKSAELTTENEDLKKKIEDKDVQIKEKDTQLSDSREALKQQLDEKEELKIRLNAALKEKNKKKRGGG